MSVAIVTGSGGLIGSEAAAFFARLGMDVVGIDNDMRRYFFGDEASTAWNAARLQSDYPNYTHYDLDIRDNDRVQQLFQQYGKDVTLIIHAAAQPSHDWAAREPQTDFTINANGTLNLLEATRHHAPHATFIFTSTNKVYGDTPNRLPLIEQETRWEIDPSHSYAPGIREDMSIDNTLHSLFGASKVAADILVQEYGRYVSIPTACFRGGCLTGPNHSGAQLHCFLASLSKCAMTGQPYTVFGYNGKQVRDVLYVDDLLNAYDAAAHHIDTVAGQIFNVGGGPDKTITIWTEFGPLLEELLGRPINVRYSDWRPGDQPVYISDITKAKQHLGWEPKVGVRESAERIYAWAKDNLDLLQHL